jgi:hypothetical protein
MPRRQVLRSCAALVLWALATSCSAPVPPQDPRDVIELRWIKGHARESRADVETGLLWGLSLLGAQLPRDAAVVRWSGERLTLDLAQARVLDGTQDAWRQLLGEMKASGEYRAHGALDVGRFMAVTLGDSARYYALTNATPDYSNARARFQFETRSAAILQSAVAKAGRRIDLARANDVTQLAFVAFEGRGSLGDGSFVAHEMELLDVMPNGQLRFALYGLDGRLKTAASPAITAAGKPAKCMWCHESKLQPTFVDFPAARGYYSRGEFDAAIAARRELLQDYRRGLRAQIDYDKLQDHTFAELLYLTFEEPTRARLAHEWGVTDARAAELLRGKPTHAQVEFPWLGQELYRREDVDALAPYAVLPAPRSVREPDEALP